MARKRVKPDNMHSIKSHSEVDDALFKIAQMRVKLKKIDAQAEEEINKIKETAASNAKELKDDIEKYENGIFAFADFNKDDLFQKKKSIELTFGLLGYRKSTKIRVKKTTLEKLKNEGLLEAIIVKETTNKDVLATYGDDVLKRLDANRLVQNSFWYEIKEVAVTQHAARQNA